MIVYQVIRKVDKYNTTLESCFYDILRPADTVISRCAYILHNGKEYFNSTASAVTRWLSSCRDKFERC